MTTRTGQIILHGVLSVSFLLFLPLSMAEELEEPPRLPLAMEVFLKKPAERTYDLHIHLTNISDETITVDVHELPWVPPNDSKWLTASRKTKPERLLEQQSFLGKFGSRTIRLLPGESIQNSMGLNSRLPSLLEDIDQFGVELRWDCPPADLRFVCRPGSPPRLTIPKGDPGHADAHTIDQQACQQSERDLGVIKNYQHENVLFVVTTESVLSDLARAQAILYRVDDYVRQCKPMWTNSWEVSFFTDKKFAGFISDLENQRYFERGLWQHANIGQYSSQIRTLFRFPWIKKKADAVYLSVYRPTIKGQGASHDHHDGK